MCAEPYGPAEEISAVCRRANETEKPKRLLVNRVVQVRRLRISGRRLDSGSSGVLVFMVCSMPS